MTYNRGRIDEVGPFKDFLYTTLNGSQISSETVGPTVHRKNVCQDVNTPDYALKVSKGTIINNPVSMTFLRIANPATGSARQTRLSNQDVYGRSGPLTVWLIGLTGGTNRLQRLPVYAASSEERHALIGLAKFQAVANIDRTPYAFAEDAGEVRETLRFLKSPMRGLRELATKYRKSVTKRTRHGPRLNVSLSGRHSVRTNKTDWAKAHADAWLEYRFAASPLVRSAYDLAESLIVPSPARPRRLVARGTSFVDVSKEEVANYTGSGLLVSASHADVCYLKVRAGILYEVLNPFDGSLFRYGLRAKDIPETVWALMPYSFMVDRVVDISGAIRGVTQLLDPKVKILAGWVTLHEHSGRTTHVRGVSQSGFSWTSVVGEPHEHALHAYKRDPWSPSIADTIPAADVRGLVDSATKLLDLASLTLAGFDRR